MSPSRRAPMDPSFPGWDPDPLHVDEDPEPRVPSFGWEHRRRPKPDGAPGPAIVLAIVGIPLLVLILFAIAWAASRPGPDPTAPQPGASDATGSVRAPALVQASASGRSQSGAPHTLAKPARAHGIRIERDGGAS